MKVKDAVIVVAGLGIGYGLYRLLGGAARIGDAAGDVVQGAYGRWLNITQGKAELTKPAQLSRDQQIARGFMKKVHAPFPGCQGDSCYRYLITPVGEAYIARQRAQGER